MGPRSGWIIGSSTSRRARISDRERSADIRRIVETITTENQIRDGYNLALKISCGIHRRWIARIFLPAHPQTCRAPLAMLQRRVDSAHQAALLNNNSDEAAKRGTLGSPRTRATPPGECTALEMKPHGRMTEDEKNLAPPCLPASVVALFPRDFFPGFTARWQQKPRVKRIRDFARCGISPRTDLI